jgi:serine/threonine protein phosphatase PrpC
MDIIKHLSSIEIPTENKEKLLQFLIEKESEINGYVLKMWEDFNLNNSDKLANVELPAIEDVSVEIKTKDICLNSELNNDTFGNTPNPEVEFNSDNPIIILATEEKEDLNQASEKENLNANTEKKSNIINEPSPKQPDPQLEIKASDAFAGQIKSKNIIFPNGKASQTYNFLFDIDGLGLNDLADYWFEGLEQIGLVHNTETKEITGIPLLAGDHKIILKIKRNDWSEGKPIFEREINLIINPDPKTLWKNIPTPTDIEYFKPDSDKSYVKVEAVSGFLGTGKSPRKDMVAASQRGRSHAQEGKARDDDFALKYIKEHDWYIMAVADGAGSAKSSRKGSEIACNTVKKVCEQFIRSHHKEFEQLIKEFSSDKTGEKRKKMGDSLYKILGNAVFKSLKNIEEEAKTSSKPTKDFATTLIISICKKFKFGWFVGAFWVGDGGIGIYNKETKFLKVLGESDGGEFAGQTRFLTMPEITQPAELYRRLRFDIVDDFTALILMTDGVTDPKFETDANLGRFEKWDELWDDLSKEVKLIDDNTAAADQLLSWLDFWSPGNHDDRTIAILY